jgi:DNA-binding NarL/FixJ family response regulator
MATTHTANAPNDGGHALLIAVLSERSLFREGLLEVLRKLGHNHVIQASTTRGLLRILRRRPTAIVFVDLELERENPGNIVRRVHAMNRTTSVVMIGTTLQNAARARTADGWLETPKANAARLKRMAAAARRPHRARLRFRQSVRLARARRPWDTLTRRQQQVLERLSKAEDNLKIAAELGVSERAIKAHVSALLRRFGADNRTELAVLGARAGFPGPPVASGHILGG